MHTHKESKDTDIAARLRSVGLKATASRIEILKVLSRGCEPLTVEELHAELKHSHCDLVTLYRALASFQKLRLVRRCDLGHGPVRFEAHDHGGEHHHHVVCTECRSIESVDICIVDELEKSLKKKGYSNLTHSLEFFGICKGCTKTPKLRTAARTRKSSPRSKSASRA